jgi:citrate lyase subunit beta/citryl-CoA lyase
VYDQTADFGHESSEPGTRIDPVLARSWLLVNGAQPDRFAAAAHSRADIVVLDIEDAVAPKDKAAARDNVGKWLTAGNNDWVRVNGFGTRWWADDLDMLATTSVAATKGTFRLAFGIGDFRRDTGFGDNPATLAYARSRFTIAAKAAHLPSAIDGPTIGSSALKLIEASAVSVEFGMTGKICLSPDQCPSVNEGLSPSQDEISWANEFFAEFQRDGGEIRNGSDLPRIARATKILDLAKAYGIHSSETGDDPDHVPAPSDTYHY